jgi:hypothetical protein
MFYLRATLLVAPFAFLRHFIQLNKHEWGARLIKYQRHLRMTVFVYPCVFNQRYALPYRHLLCFYLPHPCEMALAAVGFGHRCHAGLQEFTHMF